MGNIAFAWDDRKARANLVNFLLLGLSHRAQCLIVSHGYREDNSVVRLISARRATKLEQEAYWSSR